MGSVKARNFEILILNGLQTKHLKQSTIFFKKSFFAIWTLYLK